MLKKGTKRYVISIITIMIIFLIGSILISLTNEDVLMLISFSSLMEVTLAYLLIGILKIKTFIDYNKEYKLLCVDGVFNILTCISMILGFVFVPVYLLFFALIGVNFILYVVAGFALLTSIYTLIIAIKMSKNKIKYSCFEYLTSLFWLIIGLGFVLINIDSLLNLSYCLIAGSSYLIILTLIIKLIKVYLKDNSNSLIKSDNKDNLVE